MARVSKTKRIEVAPEELWKKVGGWGSIHEWHPAIASTEVSEDGAGRVLTLGDGGVIRERRLNEGERSYTYRFEESPLPVKDYESTIKVLAEGDGSVMEWEGTFEPDGVDEPQAVELMGGIYQAGLDAL